MKYYGKVYYAEYNKADGIVTESLRPLECYGDVVRNRKKWEQGIGVNDDIDISNEFSLMLKPELLENFMSLKYIEWKGVRWKISAVELVPPRLTIQVGGVYNEEEERTSEDSGEDSGKL